MALPAAVAAVLCLLQISARSLWLDEAATAAIAGQHGGALGAAIAHDGGNMAGYYFLVHLVAGAFGNGALAIRAPSAVAAAAAAGLVAAIGLRVFDRRIGLVAGLLTAVSLPLVFWGQNARGYAPMVALVCASVLAFVSVVEGKASGRRIVWPWIAYVCSTALAIYLSFVAVLIVPAELVALGWRRGRALRVASALAACAVCCAPLVVLAARRGSGQLFWVPRPTATGVRDVVEAVSSAALRPNFHPGATSGVLLTLTLLLMMLASVSAVRRTLAARGDGRAWDPVLAVSWLLVPLAIALVESLLGQPIFVARNLLLVLPAVALLLAHGAFHRRVPVGLSWALVAMLLALRALALAPAYGVSPEDWRAATSYVLARSTAADCIAFYPSDGRMAFAYYLASARGGFLRAPLSVLPTAAWSVVRPYLEDYAAPSQAQLAHIRSRCPRLWLLASHVGQPDGPALSRAHRRRYFALRSRLVGVYGGHVSWSVVGYASPIEVRLFARATAATDGRTRRAVRG